MWILALFFKNIAVLELRCASVSCTLLGDVQRTRFYYLSWVSRCSIHILPAGVELQTLQLMQSSNVLCPESFSVVFPLCPCPSAGVISLITLHSLMSLPPPTATYLLTYDKHQAVMHDSVVCSKKRSLFEYLVTD